MQHVVPPSLVLALLTTLASPPAVPYHDCNGNGVEDAEDIAYGDSRDENLNGIPDECESAAPAVPRAPRTP